MPVFYTWGFPALGAPTNRTLPTRLSEVVNVKDWGAIGNNSSNDGPNIQAAINYCIAQGGGRVFFPPGDYVCTSTNLVIGSDTDPTAFVQLVGSGGGANGGNCKIVGPSSGWALSAGTKTYDLLQRVEGLGVYGKGSIKVTGTAVCIKNCYISSTHAGIDASQANGCSISDCGGNGGDTVDATAAGPYVFSTTGIGVFLGNNCLVHNCRMGGGYFITYALSGNGAALIGCSTETTYMGARVGWKPDPNPAVIGVGVEGAAYACTVQGLETERQQTALELYNATGCLIAGNFLSGGTGQSSDQQITNLSWSAGTVTVTTTAAHNLPVGNTVILLNINGLAPGVSPWRPTFYTVATRTGSTTFTYPLASNPGAAPGYFSPLVGWSYPADFCIRVRVASECALIANLCSLSGYQASVDLNYGGAAVHSNNLFVGTPGGRGWLPPLGANAAAWKFVQVGVDALTVDSNPHANAALKTNPCGSMTFSNLPAGFESQEFSINDGAKSGGGAAVWGDTVQGAGTGKYLVRYDGAVWKRIG